MDPRILFSAVLLNGSWLERNAVERSRPFVIEPSEYNAGLVGVGAPQPDSSEGAFHSSSTLSDCIYRRYTCW